MCISNVVIDIRLIGVVTQMVRVFVLKWEIMSLTLVKNTY